MMKRTRVAIVALVLMLGLSTGAKVFAIDPPVPNNPTIAISTDSIDPPVPNTIDPPVPNDF